MNDEKLKSKFKAICKWADDNNIMLTSDGLKRYLLQVFLRNDINRDIQNT